MSDFKAEMMLGSLQRSPDSLYLRSPTSKEREGEVKGWAGKAEKRQGKGRGGEGGKVRGGRKHLQIVARAARFSRTLDTLRSIGSQKN